MQRCTANLACAVVENLRTIVDRQRLSRRAGDKSEIVACRRWRRRESREYITANLSLVALYLLSYVYMIRIKSTTYMHLIYDCVHCAVRI